MLYSHLPDNVPENESYTFVVNVGGHWMICYNQPEVDPVARDAGQRIEPGWYFVGSKNAGDHGRPRSWHDVRVELQKYSCGKRMGQSPNGKILRADGFFVVRSPDRPSVSRRVCYGSVRACGSCCVGHIYLIQNQDFGRRKIRILK